MSVPAATVIAGPGDPIWLETCLAPLLSYLARPNVTDLHVNQPGELWIEALGLPPQREAVPELTGALLQRLARQIAAITADTTFLVLASQPVLATNAARKAANAVVTNSAMTGAIKRFQCG